ncbi:MAG: tRNA pseudouridine(55) synthase TruB [Bacteroidaceae bacterium]|mgnify:CR=1 FL=1|nr:tRNA pseudouridine(55) synthase TruB [Bacteroidaceae bacterium]
MNPQEGEILSFNKPYEWTSFNVVAAVRNLLRRKLNTKKIKVGHAGTLDPLATGVLLVCTGKATKRIEELQAHTKEYVATLKIGATTPSFDKETEEDATYPTDHITRELLESTLKTFIGSIEQVPPTYSAVKVNGKRAYEFARTGRDVELKAKTLVIDEIELLSCNLPHEAVIRVVCSKGTYIRALARDIGIALGSGAYLTDLMRTRIGEYRLVDCMDIKDFPEWLDKQEIVNNQKD